MGHRLPFTERRSRIGGTSALRSERFFVTLVARIRRLPSIALAAGALGALAVALIASAPAAAASSESCARAIVNDWYGDGKVDKIYPQHCYREAIRSLPVDVRDYSNAEEDILRALAYAKKGEPDPGPAGKGGQALAKGVSE